MKSIVLIALLAGAGYAAYMAYSSSLEEEKEARTIKGLPPSVQHVVGQMDGASQAAFFNEFDRKRKKKSVGWIMWMLFGWHYLYARKVGMQFVFWLTFGGLGLWWLADLFRMPSIIRSANEQIAREALQTLHIGVAFAGIGGAGGGVRLSAPPVGAPVAAVPTMPPPSAPTLPAAPVGHAAGWMTDPSGRHESRYWDGIRWTDHVATRGLQSTDVL